MPIQIHDLSEIRPANSHEFDIGTDTLGFKWQQLQSGKSAGVEQVTLRCGQKTITVLATRGMGIWEATHGGVRFGWNSPIDGPIHPQWVPLSEPSGLGWLDGFDEMLVRCGLAANGAPEFDSRNQLASPLHGRIANLPASNVQIEIDDQAETISIRGTVHENRFHIQRLQLETEITLRADSHEISIADRVTNLSDRPASFQMLYHNNFGPPILEAGSQFFAPIKKLVPRNDHAAQNVETWNQFQGPDPTYAEQVYFAELHAGPDNQTLAVVTNREKTLAASVRFDVSTLPYLSIWKNTVGMADGYVTGIEPGTNFPNPRGFEEQHDRVVRLPPGQHTDLNLAIGMLVKPAHVQAALEAVDNLAGDAQILESPTDNWCSV
ncbi:MAG: galactose mutarotase-like enzyme [Mariniblastus sp.]|jgi:galactose mutarotase-like enzyme